jgi:hypothetical protein
MSELRERQRSEGNEFETIESADELRSRVEESDYISTETPLKGTQMTVGDAVELLAADRLTAAVYTSDRAPEQPAAMSVIVRSFRQLAILLDTTKYSIHDHSYRPDLGEEGAEGIELYYHFD